MGTDASSARKPAAERTMRGLFQQLIALGIEYPGLINKVWPEEEKKSKDRQNERAKARLTTKTRPAIVLEGNAQPSQLVAQLSSSIGFDIVHAQFHTAGVVLPRGHFAEQLVKLALALAERQAGQTTSKDRHVSTNDEGRQSEQAVAKTSKRSHVETTEETMPESKRVKTQPVESTAQQFNTANGSEASAQSERESHSQQIMQLNKRLTDLEQRVECNADELPSNERSRSVDHVSSRGPSGIHSRSPMPEEDEFGELDFGIN